MSARLIGANSAQADIDLPRIAVIGNQSAGKSSLVEAISGVRCLLSGRNTLTIDSI